MSQAGGWLEALSQDASWLGSQREQPSSLSLRLPGMEMRDGGCTGMSGCGKKALGEGLELALQWEMQRRKAVQMHGGKSEL